MHLPGHSEPGCAGSAPQLSFNLGLEPLKVLFGNRSEICGLGNIDIRAEILNIR